MGGIWIWICYPVCHAVLRSTWRRYSRTVLSAAQSLVSGTAVLNPIIGSFNVPVFNFWWCFLTPPPTSKVVFVQISYYSISALRRSYTFTTFTTKFIATCAATSIPNTSPMFVMTYSIRPCSSQAASFGLTLPNTGTYPACYKAAWIACTPSTIGTNGLLFKS